MDLFHRKRIAHLEAQIALSQREARSDRLKVQRERDELESRISSLEDAARLLSAKVNPTQIEDLAREMIAAIPLDTDEAGLPDNKRRIIQAFDLARAWVAERDK